MSKARTAPRKGGNEVGDKGKDDQIKELNKRCNYFRKEHDDLLKTKFELENRVRWLTDRLGFATPELAETQLNDNDLTLLQVQEALQSTQDELSELQQDMLIQHREFQQMKTDSLEMKERVFDLQSALEESKQHAVDVESEAGARISELMLEVHEKVDIIAKLQARCDLTRLHSLTPSSASLGKENAYRSSPGRAAPSNDSAQLALATPSKSTKVTLAAHLIQAQLSDLQERYDSLLRVYRDNVQARSKEHRYWKEFKETWQNRMRKWKESNRRHHKKEKQKSPKKKRSSTPTQDSQLGIPGPATDGNDLDQARPSSPRTDSSPTRGLPPRGAISNLFPDAMPNLPMPTPPPAAKPEETQTQYEDEPDLPVPNPDETQTQYEDDEEEPSAIPAPVPLTSARSQILVPASLNPGERLPHPEGGVPSSTSRTRVLVPASSDPADEAGHAGIVPESPASTSANPRRPSHARQSGSHGALSRAVNAGPPAVIDSTPTSTARPTFLSSTAAPRSSLGVFRHNFPTQSSTPKARAELPAAFRKPQDAPSSEPLARHRPDVGRVDSEENTPVGKTKGKGKGKAIATSRLAHAVTTAGDFDASQFSAGEDRAASIDSQASTPRSARRRVRGSPHKPASAVKGTPTVLGKRKVGQEEDVGTSKSAKKNLPLDKDERAKYLRDLNKLPHDQYVEGYKAFKGNGRYGQQIPKHGEEGINAKYEIDKSKNNGKDYQYDEVVRNREQRKQLHGTDCECCRDYYEAVGPLPPRLEAPLWKSPSPSPRKKRKVKAAQQSAPSSSQESPRSKAVQAHKQEVSRHRQLWVPSNTPPDYWNIGFPDTQQAADINRRADEMHRKKEQQIAREANKKDGRYKKRN